MTGKDFKISIIIPTYNQEEYIASAIRSAISQSYKNIEIIVSDDCSSDNTGKIAQSFSDVVYSRNSTNLGRVRNYRKALYELATGDYVLNMDADDFLVDHDFISYAVSLIQEINPIMLVACKQLNGTDTKYLHRIKTDNETVSGVDFVSGIGYKYTFSHLTTLYKRKSALNSDFYREDILSSDMESLLRLALKGDVVVSNKVVGQWNSTNSNASKYFSFQETLTNMKWIVNVEKDLKEFLSPFQLFAWRLKLRKKYFSGPFLNAFRQEKDKKDNFIQIVKKGMLLFFLMRGLRVMGVEIKRRIKSVL